MYVEPWLEPVYAGIGSIVVDDPLRILVDGETLATGDRHNCGTLARDRFVDERHGFTWAGVHVHPRRMVATIAGEVAYDSLVEESDNQRWLLQLCEFLLQERAAERRMTSSPLRSSVKAFLSHRSSDKTIVREVAAGLRSEGVDVWLDEDEIALGESISGHVDKALQRATHFVLFWSASCVGAPWVERELAVAVHQLIDRRMPVIVVRLDGTPVPTIISDLKYISIDGATAVDAAAALATAIRR